MTKKDDRIAELESSWGFAKAQNDALWDKLDTARALLKHAEERADKLEAGLAEKRRLWSEYRAMWRKAHPHQIEFIPGYDEANLDEIVAWRRFRAAMEGEKMTTYGEPLRQTSIDPGSIHEEARAYVYEVGERLTTAVDNAIKAIIDYWESFGKEQK